MTLRWWNTLPVSPKNFQQYLQEGRNLAFVPGGYEEATLTSRHHERVYIRHRKGFIKYALKYGYTVFPVYTFNETRLYYTLDSCLNFRLWLNKFKMIGIAFFSPYLWVLPEPSVDLHSVKYSARKQLLSNPLFRSLSSFETQRSRFGPEYCFSRYHLQINIGRRRRN